MSDLSDEGPRPPNYQVMPPLSDEEYADLRADIAANGVRVPVDVDEHGVLLDGHHRARIADELDVGCPRRVVPGLTESQKLQHALVVNTHRRNLTREQRRDLLAASLRAEPEASDREHARRVGTDHKTVAVVRDSLAAGGEIPHLVERRGPDGKAYPATQPPRAPAGVESNPPPTVAQYVEKYPDLAAYADDEPRVIRLGIALDGYPAHQLPGRLETLRKSIAADARPRPDEGPDFYAMADAMFAAVNAAARAITRNGGLPTLNEAVMSADSLMIETWRQEFSDTAKTLSALADGCRPALRGVR